MVRGPSEEEYKNFTSRGKIIYWTCFGITFSVFVGLLLKRFIF